MLHDMGRFAARIDDHLEMFRRGDADDAFHGLLEIDREIIPELMAVFRREKDVGMREFLIAIIWEHRDRSVIPFLGEVLMDPEPRIWREALNGLVGLACPAALEALRAARAREFPQPCETEEFRRWLEEAIGQAELEARRE